MMEGKFWYIGEKIVFRCKDGTEYGGFERFTIEQIRLKPGLEAPILIPQDEREGG